MKESLTERTSNAALWLLGLCAVATVSAVVFYVCYFGPGSDYKLSSADTTAWANFGTYLGGVLGPFFGLLAFIGVLFTVMIHARQLDVAQKQAGLEEFQRSLSSCAIALDAILGRRISKPLYGQINEGVVTVSDLIAGGGHSALSENVEYLVKARNEKIMFAAKTALKEDASDLLSELDHLVWCLKAYEEEGGRPKVIELYRRRFLPIVIWLEALGLINEAGNVDKYFDPRGNRYALIP